MSPPHAPRSDRALVLSLALLLAGCAGVGPREHGWKGPVLEAPSAHGAAVAQALDRHFARWRSVPYRYGGSDASGVDCSGFVQLTYARLFDVPLPRTTATQRVAGRDVTGRPLVAGDLVFFSIDGPDSHVGIYAGGGHFVHASSGRGVTRDRVDAPYWVRRYSRTVRVLPEPASQRSI